MRLSFVKISHGSLSYSLNNKCYMTLPIAMAVLLHLFTARSNGNRVHKLTIASDIATDKGSAPIAVAVVIGSLVVLFPYQSSFN